MLALVFCGDVSQWHVIHHSHQEALPLQSWRANMGWACFNVLRYTLYPKNVLWSFRIDMCTCMYVCATTYCIKTHSHGGTVNAFHTPPTPTCQHSRAHQHVAHQGHTVFASWDICKMWYEGGWWSVCVCVCLGTGVFSPRTLSQAGRLNALD